MCQSKNFCMYGNFVRIIDWKRSGEKMMLSVLTLRTISLCVFFYCIGNYKIKIPLKLVNISVHAVFLIRLKGVLFFPISQSYCYEPCQSCIILPHN
jgi:hypothetical protein